MIVIERSKQQIKINGHANYDVIGKDIVCAAVSILIQTLIQSIEEMTDDKIKYKMKPGKVRIKFWSLSDVSKALINSFFIGCQMIADENPENVKVITA